MFYVLPFILQTFILTGPLVIAVTLLLKRLSCMNMVYYYHYYYYYYHYDQCYMLLQWLLNSISSGIN